MLWKTICLSGAMMLAACSGEAGHSAHGSTDGEHVFAAEKMPVIDDDYVGNFALIDHRGESHELYYHQDAPAIAIMVQGNGCPIVRHIASDYKALRDVFAPQGVEFMMLNANAQDSREEVAAEAEALGIDMPILKDEAQIIAASLDVDRTAEVIVIDPASWEIAYRGPVNDRVGYARQKDEADETWLADALSAMVEGREVEVKTRPTKGCIVNLGDALDTESHAKISYADTIAPILIENCVDCHQEGGIGPWAMASFDDVEGYSLMMREVVRTGRMPPWSADPLIGHFDGARSLSVDDKQTLVRWIEAGAPRGDGEDPLAERVSDATEWPLGEPDLIIEAPEFAVPATGIVDYQFPTVPNPLETDKWVRAITVVPGDKTVVHHALIGSSPEITPPGEGNEGDVFDNYLVGFVPGSESYVYPGDSGVLVKGGGEYRFQMHYTTSGMATTDVTRVGLYFHDERPAHVLRQQVAINQMINIPAGAKDHVESAYFTFDHPAEIVLLFPHAHYRGKSTRFDLEYPDGRVEPILSVPDYDFNWQHNYPLAEPLRVPAGTKLIHETVYDNSELNDANPDPERDVPWGLQSHDEMLYGSFFFRWAEETHDNPVHDPLQFGIRQFYGFVDRDRDERIAYAEMTPWMREGWDEGRLKPVDTDGDAAISFDEFYAWRRARAQSQ